MIQIGKLSSHGHCNGRHMSYEDGGFERNHKHLIGGGVKEIWGTANRVGGGG